VDGDADRVALFDAEGNYVDSHHVILLLIHYLAGYKKLGGKIVTGFSSTVKVEKLAAHYGLEVERVEIGFKKIAEVMLKEDVLVGGEESGGISIKGNIPERDGIWNGLSIFQFMAETGKSLRELINEVYDIILLDPPYAYNKLAELLCEITGRRLLTENGIIVTLYHSSKPPIWRECGLDEYKNKVMGITGVSYWKWRQYYE